ncbi:hypothetical protein [Paludibaculum fermentans]|uniref:hypothetical protein n=1 Tax=Paludibaculum fermentans TaxID=1473598 RepID=UPI003EBE7EB0
MNPQVKIEYDTERKIRTRNKTYYRVNHWPIWIFVFFLIPGPVTFKLFAEGFGGNMVWWLAAVLVGTGIAGLRGRLPGSEPAPYIIRFTEDRPNPVYRRICYTFAWGAAISYGLLNLVGLVVAVTTGKWMMKQIYWYGYFPVVIPVWILGALGKLPRVKPSTAGEGHERRYFYGTVWAMCIAQPTVGILWKILPRNRTSDVIELVTFVSVLALVGWMSVKGLLPRTRRILPGEIAALD